MLIIKTSILLLVISKALFRTVKFFGINHFSGLDTTKLFFTKMIWYERKFYESWTCNMSMIFFCQSDKDLRRYGLKSIYDVGLMFPDEIAATLGLSGKLWSSTLFCTLWDESWEMTRSYNNDKLAFSETPIYYFLNEVLDNCDKAAFFYCEPIHDKTDWETFKDKQSLLSALNRNFQKESYNDVFLITFLFDKQYI